MISIIVSLFISFLIAYYLGSKRKIGMGWSLFFCVYFSLLFPVVTNYFDFELTIFLFNIIFATFCGLIITLSSKNRYKELSKSLTKKNIGWFFTIFGILVIISTFILLEDMQANEVKNSVIFSVGFLSAGYYLIKTSKGAKPDEIKFYICKYCKSELVLSDNELSQEKFTCPNCKKVNYLNNDNIYYCQNCDLEVELDPNERKNRKFTCPECREENYLGD